MRKRLSIAAAVMVGVVGLAYGVAWWFAPVHRITPDTAKKIHEGMTRAEVEAIFRVPPGDYRSPDDANLVAWQNPDAFPSGCSFEVWQARNVAVSVCFDQDGKVLSQAIGATGDGPSWLDRVRRFLHL